MRPTRFSGAHRQKRTVSTRWPAAVAVLIILSTGGRAAATERLQLTYTLYIGYFSALNVDATISLAAGRYQIEALVAPKSWIAWALPWTLRSFAKGRIESGVIRPEHAQSAGSWAFRTRNTDFDFSADGNIRVTFDPPIQDDSREPVAESLKTGSIDPVSAVATMSEAARGDEGCSPVMPVFDGRRRFDIRGDRQPATVMPASSYTAYAGPVTACRLTFVTLAGGYRNGEHSRFWQTPKPGEARPPVDVWLARLRSDQPPLPVYAIGDSILGPVTVYLSAFRFEPE